MAAARAVDLSQRKKPEEFLAWVMTERTCHKAGKRVQSTGEQPDASYDAVGLLCFDAQNAKSVAE